MTWPFENDTSAITKKLALKSIKADRQKLLYTSLTIAIAVTLIMTLSMAFLGTQRNIQRQADCLPQAVMYHVVPDTYEKIQSDPAIDSTIIQYSFPEIDYKNRITIQTIYSDNPVALSNASLQGELPQEIDEIALSSESLSHFPEDTGIGNAVLLDLGNGEREYTVTGIITLNSEFPNKISVYCSQKYLFEAVNENQIEYTLFLFLNRRETMSKNDAKIIVDALTEKYSANHNDAIVNSRYFTLSERNISISELLDYILIALVVLVAAAVVIYNIFYISITRKIQEYGQLRTIGMTSKQMKRLITREGLRIAIPSIIAGIVAGAVFGYIIQPEGGSILGFAGSALFSFVFGILTVSISIHSPAKMASKISPVEALRFSSYATGKSSERNRQYRITPLRLAVLNLGRSKKRTFLTILSLGLCGVMLIACASVQNSLSEIHMARANEFQYGEFKLEFEGNDAELEQEILSIDGVKGIKKWYATTALFEVDGNENGQTTVFGYTVEELEKMNSVLVSGVTDPATLEQYKSGIFMAYILVLFFALFGIINLVNLTVTNQLIRRKENSILLAVGLTRRQLWKTRLLEGEALIIASILVASIIGIPVGYLVANTFRMTGAVEQYIFPFKEYGIFLIMLIVIDILLEFILNRALKKQSLIEQIRSIQ